MGWNTLPRGGGEFYAAGSTLTMPAGDLTLYAQWSGNGSAEDNPILITDAQGMKDIGASDKSRKKHYRLCNDLVLDDWEAIYFDYGGGQGEPFSGTFDGGGHTVTLNGVKPIQADFNMASGYFISLFAEIEGEVRRLRVDGQITVDGTDENAEYYAGGICGYIYGGTVTDCISNVTVTAMGKMKTLYAGSIAGWNTFGGPIFNCYATGKIESTAIVKYVYLGGIAGFNDNCIANCAAFNSNISGNKGQLNTYIGRIAYNTSANIVNNYASATSAAFTDKGLNKPNGADCDAKPAASWWKEPGRWANSYTTPAGSTKPLTPWNFTTTWEVTDGNLPVLLRE